MATDHAESMLNALLDKFDRSSMAFGTEGRKNRSISISVGRDKVLKEYTVQDCYLFRPDIEAAARKLEDEGLCTILWDEERNTLEKIFLNLENIDKAFAYAGRIRRSVVDQNEYDAIEKRLSLASEDVSRQFLQEMSVLVSSHSSHAKWYSDLDELDTLLSIIKAMESQKTEILLRNFSKRNFGDSKLFERYSSKLTSIYRAFGMEPDIDFETLCETHSIVRNTGYTYLKNGITLTVGKLCADLNSYPFEFALSHKAIDTIKISSITAKKLITIENLTTFNYFNDPEAIVIYLGGYAGRYEIELIKMIYASCPNIEYLHLGDIDWGGFEILIDLRKRTSIDFRPYLMSIAQLEKYRVECLPLTDNDRNNISRMLDDPKADEFKDVLTYMLENGYKLEQESLQFIDD